MKCIYPSFFRNTEYHHCLVVIWEHSTFHFTQHLYFVGINECCILIQWQAISVNIFRIMKESKRSIKLFCFWKIIEKYLLKLLLILYEMAKNVELLCPSRFGRWSKDETNRIENELQRKVFWSECFAALLQPTFTVWSKVQWER